MKGRDGQISKMEGRERQRQQETRRFLNGRMIATGTVVHMDGIVFSKHLQNFDFLSKKNCFCCVNLNILVHIKCYVLGEPYRRNGTPPPKTV